MVTAVRFPVTVGQGVAFREVARRHGDFAIVAIAAIATDKWFSLGIGGLTGQPVVSGVRTDHHMPDWFETWLGQLEGYDDLHASAAMRRDLCRNLAPDVIAEAQQCAA